MMAENIVVLHCLKMSCPRSKTVTLLPCDSPGTVHIVAHCPWHLKEGDKESTILFYDKNWHPIINRKD